MDGLTDDKTLSPLLKRIEEAEIVNCKVKEIPITLERKNNEYKANEQKIKEGGRQWRDLIFGGIGLILSLIHISAHGRRKKRLGQGIDRNARLSPTDIPDTVAPGNVCGCLLYTSRGGKSE